MSSKDLHEEPLAASVQVGNTSAQLPTLCRKLWTISRNSVAVTIANGGLTADLDVSVFLTSAAVDLVRKHGVESTQVNPLEPLKGFIDDFVKRGGKLWGCTPYVKARGYEADDLIDGVAITGASKMHELIKTGAATLSF